MNRFWGALAALFLLWASPAAAQTAEQDYQSGVAAHRAGEFVEAIRLLRRAATAEPDNADIHLQIGLSHLALDQLDEAETALRRTLELAPDYADARDALDRVARRRADQAAALDAAAEPAVEALAVAAPVDPVPSRWRIDLDTGFSAFEGGPDWVEGSVAIRHRFVPATEIGVALEGSRRFGLNDVYGEARVDHRLSPGAAVYLLAGATPDADFRPEWQIGAGGALRLRGEGDATVLRLDARHAEYPSGDIQTLTPGIEQYVAGGRAWLTAQWINVFDGDLHSAGWLARGDVMATPALRLFAGLSDAPDLSEGVVTDIFSVFGGAAWDVGERLTLRAGLAHEDRDGRGDRQSLALGVGLRF